MSKLGCMGSGNIWKDTVTYDELTINEWQKSDPAYSNLLDEIHRGCPSEQSINCLHDRIISVSVIEKHKQLYIYVNQEIIPFVYSQHVNNVKSTTVVC